MFEPTATCYFRPQNTTVAEENTDPPVNMEMRVIESPARFLNGKFPNQYCKDFQKIP